MIKWLIWTELGAGEHRKRGLSPPSMASSTFSRDARILTIKNVKLVVKKFQFNWIRHFEAF